MTAHAASGCELVGRRRCDPARGVLLPNLRKFEPLRPLVMGACNVPNLSKNGISTGLLRFQGGHGDIEFVHETGDVILHADIAMKLFG